MNRPVRAGVVGTGSMGSNHARVLDELQATELIGVFDTDDARAATIAESFNTRVRPFAELIEAADVVTVAVPTAHHYETVHACIEAGTHVLVEKPFVDSVQRGESLIEFAAAEGVVLQVGHVERFNPAVQKLLDICDELDIIALDAHRLGPTDRTMDDTAVMDLMIHDIDIVLQLLGEPIDVAAAATPDGEYATATIETSAGQIGSMTASRVTEEKVRKLTITATDCRVKLDYIGQTIEICRRSMPEYIREDGSVNYHHENVIEQLIVERCEPLKNEIASFVDCVVTGATPAVTGEDGLRAVELAQRINGLTRAPKRTEETTPLP